MSLHRLFKDATELKSEIQKSFNERLTGWFENALRDYNVKGEGHAYFDELPREVEPNYIVNDFHVYFVENGVKQHAVFSATDEQLFENKLDWLFDIWSEGSMPTTKEAG
jgi:hypothetical protein